ncbi:MAG TPA: 4'-phosphopantetheinyl transferase superfamily protein [Vicinamibacterales bacterium]|nr:4'-phosphopantetheinyl transferase superfamily protein [Vicinamibacterales bacterium]
MEPKQIRFRYGPHGKPALASDHAMGALCFNSSHSHELALYAVTRDRLVGVDVEHVSRFIDAHEIAERFFSPSEIATLRSLQHEEKEDGFFACWTRKEAYVKARGDGLAMPLDSFSVSLSPGDPARILHVEGHPEETSRWFLCGLDAAPSYVAALVVEGRTHRFSRWQVPGN